MKGNLGLIINCVIPLLIFAAIAFGVGYYFYLGELRDGNDADDSLQWAFIGVLLVSPILFTAGGFFAVLIKFIRAEVSERK